MILEIDDLHFSYVKHEEILHGVSCKIETGKLTAIIGPNGCGKTTMVKCINKIHAPSAGKILFNGEDLVHCARSTIAKRIGYVPQVSSEGLGGTVIDFILLGRRQYLSWKLRAEDLRAVLDVLEKLNIAHLANKNYGELSGGQKQKVLVARALLQQPEMFLFDEPTSNLDLKNQLEIMELARGIVDHEHKTAVIVVHDLNMALHYADHVILMEAGRIVCTGIPNDVLTVSNIEKVYGVHAFVEECGYVNPFH